jgi:hypothetical protein
MSPIKGTWMMWNHMNHPPCSTLSPTPPGCGWKISRMARASGAPSMTTLRNTKRSTFSSLKPQGQRLTPSTSKHHAT